MNVDMVKSMPACRQTPFQVTSGEHAGGDDDANWLAEHQHITHHKTGVFAVKSMPFSATPTLAKQQKGHI